jgi:transcriptional regulator with XRE-family HTH domain
MATRRHRYASLSDYFESSGETQSALAARLKVPQSTLCRIASGQRTPRPRLAQLLILICGIPAESFTAAYLSYPRKRKKRKAA